MERCRFAMLGACTSALASIHQMPDELLGLPVALLQAGVGAVAATFWPVYNTTAEPIIRGVFAAHRQAGLPPAAAARATMASLRDGGADSTGLAAMPKAAVWNDGAIPDYDDAPLQSALINDFSQPLHWAVVGVFGR